jgi:hypothetical protein
MIGEMKHKIETEKTSSIIDALKKGYTPEEIKRMTKRTGETHPKLEIYDIQELKLNTKLTRDFINKAHELVNGQPNPFPTNYVDKIIN